MGPADGGGKSLLGHGNSQARALGQLGPEGLRNSEARGREVNTRNEKVSSGGEGHPSPEAQ